MGADRPEIPRGSTKRAFGRIVSIGSATAEHHNPRSHVSRTLIAFTGPDGSGKSTQLGKLVATLRERGYTVAVAHQYEPVSRPGRAIKSRVRKFSSGSEPISGSPKTGALSGVVRTAATSWWLLSGCWRANAYAYSYRKYDVLLLDRCYIDEIVRVTWKLGRRPSRAWMLLRLVPTPAVVIALEASEADGWARKKARNMSRLEYSTKRDVIAEVNSTARQWWPLTRIVVGGRSTDDIASEVWKLYATTCRQHPDDAGRPSSPRAADPLRQP